MNTTIRAIDLCAGAGGWACAARGLPITIVAAVDFWRPACETYRLNHPGVKVIEGDLREGDVQTLIFDVCHPYLNVGSPIELVLGGIPCQWLSTYRRMGNGVGPDELASERATLAAVLGIVESVAPRWWCLEDVVGLIDELPPGIPHVTIDAADFSPQRRKRVYVGRFPRPEGVGPLLKERSREVMRDRLRPGPYRIGRRSVGRKVVTSKAFAPGLMCVADPAKKAPCITQLGSRCDVDNVVADDRLPGGLRQIEWQEGARLQGFPEDYLFFGSPSDVSHQVARAIQIDTGRVILEAIVREWETSG